MTTPKTPAKNYDDIPELEMPMFKAYLWFAVLWVIFFFDILDRYALSVCLPALKKEFLLTDTQVGLLGTVFSASVVIFVIPTGIIAFKWSRRKICAVMVGFWSLATLTTGFAKNFGMLLASRFATGLGEAGYIPIAHAFISTWFPKNRRGLMMSIFVTGNQAGKTIGVMLAGWIAFTFGWRACFFIVAAPGLILAIAAWFMPDFKNEIKAKVDRMEQAGQLDNPIKKASMKEALRYTFGTPAVLTSILMSGAFVMINTTEGLWGITLFSRTFDMNVKEASTFIGLIGIMATLLLIPLGKIGDMLQLKNKQGRVLYTFFLLACFIVSVFVFTMNSLGPKSLTTAFISFGFCCLFIQFGISNVNTVTQDLLPPHYRPVAGSFIPVSNQLIGGMTGPLLCGIFSDSVGITMGFAYISIIASVLILALAMLLKVYYKRDRQKLEDMGRFDLEKA